MLNGLDIEGRPSDTRVVVAMLGDDSSVTAGRRPPTPASPTWSASRCSCTTMARRRTARAPAAPASDIHDARRGGRSAWGFPHYVLDYEERFRAKR